MQRPSHAWGVAKFSDTSNTVPELGMFNTWLDGFILCLSPDVDNDADEETCRRGDWKACKARPYFDNSEKFPIKKKTATFTI